MLDMSWHPWYDAIKSNKSMTEISFVRNFTNLVWYQEYIYSNTKLIGEIYTNIEDGGYNLRKLVPNGQVEIMETIAHFETIQDARSFVTQANGL